MPKVIVGMSGGVDSSVAAYLLKKQGYEVEGLSLILWKSKSQPDLTTCCPTKGEISKVTLQIGIPHSTIDVRNNFIEKVIEPFVDAYTSGLTPNPCVLCNRFIKFPLLMKEAEKRGAEYISTGHYARVELAESMEQRAENFFLKKGIDPKKDQSYVLYVLTQKELKRLILPLGNYKKDEIRKIAGDLNLPAAKMHESQEICFIEDRKYFKFIEKLSSIAWEPGPIVDMNGRVIGTHKGIHGYTIGQRKGLGISSPEPLYVVKIDPINNTIYAGFCEAAKKKEFFVKDLNWINPPTPPLLKGGEGGLTFRASVKVRSMMKAEPAKIFLVRSEEISASSVESSGITNIVHVVFDRQQWAPAPGQSAVFYNDDMVMGGGVII